MLQKPVPYVELSEHAVRHASEHAATPAGVGSTSHSERFETPGQTKQTPELPSAKSQKPEPHVALSVHAVRQVARHAAALS